MANFAEALAGFMELKREDKYSRYAFSTVEGVIKLLDHHYLATEFDALMLKTAIRDTVKAYSSSKATAIDVTKEFQDFIEKNFSIKAEIEYPKVDISNTFERQMYIVKALHDSNKTIDDLHNELWVNSRTLEKDIAKLRGNDNDPLQVLGKPLIVNDVKRKDGKLEFASTVHPVFLTLNLTQVLTMLKGQRQIARDPMYRKNAVITASSIWKQLSGYGKRRLLYVLRDVFNEDTKWYEDLEVIDPEMFMTESEIGMKDLKSMMLDSMKNRKPIIVEYQSNDGQSQILWCKVVPGSFNMEGIAVNSKGKEFFLIYDKIVKAMYDLEEMVES